MSAGASMTLQFVVRNNGWNVLATGPAAPASSRIQLQVGMGPATGVAFMSSDLQPGTNGTFVGSFTAPLTVWVMHGYFAVRTLRLTLCCF